MFSDEYPVEIQEKFNEYFELVGRTLSWGIVLPKFFSKNELKKVCDSHFAICQFHIERTASMRFSHQRQTFHCYGCGAGGNIFTFIAKMRGTRNRAMWFIRDNFHIPLPFTKKEWRKIKALSISEELDWENRLQFVDDIWSRFDLVDFMPTWQDEKEYYGEGDEVVLAQKAVESLITVDDEPPINPYDKFRLTRLFVIRHADYNDYLRISIKGHQQMLELLEKLKRRIHYLDDRMYLISSTAQRALDSANVILEGFMTGFSPEELFWSDNGHPQNYQAAFDRIVKIGSEKFNVLVIVTHLEYCNYLPHMIAEKIMGIKAPSIKIEKGQCCMIDFKTKTIELL